MVRLAPLQPVDLDPERSRVWHEIRRSLRSGQREMADWQGGPLAVSAVPGSGKSTGMAAAAALAIARYGLRYRQQLLVVTFARSAAANIKQKIAGYLRQLSLPQAGFSVRTLHGLALQIAGRHPERSGLDLENSTVLAPDRNHRLLRTCVERWIADNPSLYERLLEGCRFDGEETERLRRQSVLRTEVLPDLAHTAVREAKSSGLRPEDVRELATIATREDPELQNYELLAIAAGLYERYETLMRSRDAIDYDDMILAALRVLEDPTTRQLWQRQTFAVFEDEAQDSSPLQFRLLEILATDPDEPGLRHIVRVGDANQAINSTFTPADPIYFRRFCQNCQQQKRLAVMDRSGRSTPVVLDAANFVLRESIRAARKTYPDAPPPFREQAIALVPPGDPQSDANPPAEGNGVEIYVPEDICHTVQAIADRAIALLQRHPERNAAVLVRENKQGQFVARQLRSLGVTQQVPIFEVAEGERRDRVPAQMLALLRFCDRPHSPDRLKATLQVLVERQIVPPQDLDRLATQPERFLYPTPLDPPIPESARTARDYCHRFLNARLELPVYQAIGFFAPTLHYNRAELATTDKLAERLCKQTAGNATTPAVLAALTDLVNSERFEAVEDEAIESAYTRSGRLAIITAHKAKGLDWDYVFLPFLHERTLPGSTWIPPQTRFLGDANLAAVARAQLRRYLHDRTFLAPTDAWQQAQQLKIAEEYRLFYVALTRAKRLLWLSAARQAPFSWNKAEKLENQPPSPLLLALQRDFLESNKLEGDEAELPF